MSRYRIVLELDRATATGPVAPGATETLEYTDEEASCFAGENALFIRTNHSPMGGWQDERVIPWHRVLEYRKIGES